MKTILICIALIGSVLANCQPKTNEQLEDSLRDYLISVNELDSNYSREVEIILTNLLDTTWQFRQPGIFKFGTLISETYSYILISGYDSLIILDTRRPLESVMSEVFFFLDEYEYPYSEQVIVIKNINILYINNKRSDSWEMRN